MRDRSPSTIQPRTRASRAHAASGIRRRILASLLVILSLPLASPPPDAAAVQEEGTLQAAIRDPQYGPSGRLVFEAGGDLWVSGLDRDGSADGRGEADLRSAALQQLTSGPAWDRHPAWTADGAAVLFVSDRRGSTDLWRLAVDDGRPAGEPTPLTAGPDPDTRPAPLPGGGVAFVRGRGPTADLWLRAADGSERRLTRRDGPEVSPSPSPGGDRLAYVADRQVRILELPGSGDPGAGQEESEETPGGRAAESVDEAVPGTTGATAVAWSPDGQQLVFARTGGSSGVFVTPVDGSYANLLSPVPATATFSPDGKRLALAEMPAPDLGYNGDPDRLGDREVGDLFTAPADPVRLWIVDAPSPVTLDGSEVEVALAADRRARNAEAFDRVWDRLDDLYVDGGSERRRWEQMREELRPRALEASDEAELEAVVHELVSRRPPARDEVAGRAAVSSAHPLATAAGIEVLEEGGNVIDAAVAVSFALGVVEPDASGVGGYGQMVLYLEGMERPTAIEFLTRVPHEAGLENARLEDPSGPMLANVPGTVRGMELAFDRYGSGEVSWAEVLAPALRLADEGFVMDDAFTTTLARERERFLRHESSRELFFPGGEPLRPGDRFRNPDLAWTLRQIAEGGADAFYEGAVAERMVRDLRGRGNAMTLHDLDRYFAVEREPVSGTYRGHTVFSAAPAVSGGVSLVAKLHLLDHTDPFGLYSEDPRALHALIEAWKLQPSSRGRVADPSLWPVDVESVVDREAAGRRWAACFDPDRATDADDLERGRGGDPACLAEGDRVAFHLGEELPCDASDPGCTYTGTTAFAVADAAGNAVAVTQTLGTWGGNFYVTPGLGFLYNDKLRSYGSNPDGYGARLPYARNSTSIAPTLVCSGTGDERRPRLAVGAAGNAWITSAVYQVISGIVDGGLGPQAALELPRFLLSGRRTPGGDRESVVLVEDALDPAVLARLRSMGHAFRPISLRGELRMGYGAAVLIDGDGVRAGADPRRSGAAEAIR